MRRSSGPAPRARGRIVIAALALLCLAASPVAAQGRGRKVGQNKVTTPASTGSAAPLTASSSGPSRLEFASWLDDATVLAPGGAWTSLSFGYFRVGGGRQTDFPVVDAGVGLTDRVQFGVTVPYYRIPLAQGGTFAGLGDVYLSGKVSLVDPDSTSNSFGLALSPVVEVLADATPEGSRLTWGLPVDFEFRAAGRRFFGSTGVFSRGAFFAGGAMELPVADRMALTGAVTFMRSLKADPLSEAAGLPRSRGDATVVATFIASPSLAAFVGTGRTLGSNPAATSFMLNAGISMSFSARVAP